MRSRSAASLVLALALTGTLAGAAVPAAARGDETRDRPQQQGPRDDRESRRGSGQDWALGRFQGEAWRNVTVTGYYEMPFPCGQAWTGTTRSYHSPSSRSIDWNRTDDDGDHVVASAPGTVTVANAYGRTGYGRYVQVLHQNGESTLYAHLSVVHVVAGQAVDQGSLLGLVGTTGNSTGPHLHYEQRVGGTVGSATFGGQPFAYNSTAVSGNCVDVPLAANMVGRGRAELVLYRRDKRPRFQVKKFRTRKRIVMRFGRSTDQPLLGDWDGDGFANIGVRRAEEGLFFLVTPGGVTPVAYGDPGDQPIAGDWNGDGVSDVGVHRSATSSFYLRQPDGSSVHVPLGDADDVAVTGDWDGDRVTDLGVYDVGTAMFALRVAPPGAAPTYTFVHYGAPGDLPVAGDWDGNGVTDVGVWRPSTGTYYKRKAASVRAPVQAHEVERYGLPRE